MSTRIASCAGVKRVQAGADGLDSLLAMGGPLGAIVLGVGSYMGWVVLFPVRGGGSWPLCHVLPRLCNLVLPDRRLGQRVIQMRPIGRVGDCWDFEWAIRARRMIDGSVKCGSVDLDVDGVLYSYVGSAAVCFGQGDFEFSVLVVRGTY